MKAFVLINLLLVLCLSCEPKDTEPSLLSISENGRFLMTQDGDPFFWLGDTGWLLFSKLDRKEAETYLTQRSELGFNVIQVMVLHQLKFTNVYGDSALVKGDISQPKITPGDSFDDNEAYDYWDHVDFIVDLAKKKGLYMAMVPVWGTNVRSGHVTQPQAEKYATWLAERYAHQSNIIWLNGGDTKGSDSTKIWNSIGTNLKKHAPDHLATFHPFGRTKSSNWFHKSDWLDFNMFQSGHRRYDQDDTENAYGQDNWKYVRDDYQSVPIKPTIDGEPSYESIPQGLHDPSQPYWNADDVRRYAYWSVFAGAFGHTYGHNAIMQMHKPGDKDPAYGVREYWTEALGASGALQMQHLKKLMLSESYFDRIPDQSLIASGQGEGYNYQVATRGTDYAFVYTYNGQKINVALGKIEGSEVKAFWFNPRNGEKTPIGLLQNEGTRTFIPSGKVQDGNDWVLVLKSVE
ncbi:glycoside hydrolase family 140 protein [Muricauda sp. CAU 1633]|uniref:glycoside hydrolase family 140 protein n=1 Tax=Allomuricauda sp. CAU 1633 TaxID=2816036 RepID=UPI001A9097BA|nr:glycoside hydrolase family 140 protein [Muricauda sp. CAU 1633]MBO0323967.1 glycoside hydrolase family 140 protein [Muricauda sp. CAU 1633]